MPDHGTAADSLAPAHAELPTDPLGTRRESLGVPPQLRVERLQKHRIELGTAKWGGATRIRASSYRAR